MPNLKSAKKRMRQSEKRRLHNKSLKSAMKTQVKKFLKYIHDNDMENVRAEFPRTMSALDKIAQKKILHKNNIARQKATLHKRYNLFLASMQENQSEE